MGLIVWLVSILFQVVISQKFPAIFQFGNSLSDPGNAVIAFPAQFHLFTQPPYGMTYFGHATGRNTDGRLIVDFIASALGLPFLNPYLASSNFENGANFAVQGATALSFDCFKLHNFTIGYPTVALDTQFKWFLNLQRAAKDINKLGKFPSAEQFAKGLYIVGEIGGNDYFTIYKNGVSFKGLLQYVPLVVGSIENMIRSLYQTGARNFLIINVPLQGCNQPYLVPHDSKPQYDKLGCLLEFNKVGRLHKSMLKSTVKHLRHELTGAVLTIADFYGAMDKIINNYRYYGFKYLWEPCCGIFGNTTTVQCGDTVVMNGVEVKAGACSNPSEHIYWNDHFTDAFYRTVAYSFLSGEYSDPPDTFTTFK